MCKIFKDSSIILQEAVTFEDGQRGMSIVVSIPRRELDSIEVCITEGELRDALAALVGEE